MTYDDAVKFFFEFGGTDRTLEELHATQPTVHEIEKAVDWAIGVHDRREDAVEAAQTIRTYWVEKTRQAERELEKESQDRRRKYVKEPTPAAKEIRIGTGGSGQRTESTTAPAVDAGRSTKSGNSNPDSAASGDESQAPS